MAHQKVRKRRAHLKNRPEKPSNYISKRLHVVKIATQKNKNLQNSEKTTRTRGILQQISENSIHSLPNHFWNPVANVSVKVNY